MHLISHKMSFGIRLSELANKNTSLVQCGCPINYEQLKARH